MFDRHGIMIVAAICAALIGGFYLLFMGGSASPDKKSGAPEPQRVAMPQPQKPQLKKTVEHPKPKLKTDAGAVQRSKSKPTQPGGANQGIVANLEQQGVAREIALQLKTEHYAIPDDVFQHLSKASNWMPELQKAASSVMVGANGEPSMLRVYDLASDSILREFGIQDGDVVALINGEVPIFSPSKAIEYTQKAYNLITDLQEGRPVSITVLRNGRPVNLVYQKW